MNKLLIEAIRKLHDDVNDYEEELTATVISKSGEDEKRLFYAVVIEPMTQVTEDGDTHGHVMKAEEVEESAHHYMEMGATVFQQHVNKVDAVVVESYIAPVDFVPDGGENDDIITKGSWVMAVKVKDDAVWDAIKKGEVTAFSPGGYGVITDLE